MSMHRRARPVLAAALAAVAITALAAGAATGHAGHDDAGERITAAGVGDVTVGATARELRRAGLIGRLRPGCELGGPETRSAALKAPLEGSVDFTTRGRRRVRTIAITDGATARGAGVGDRARKVRRAFPRARFDHRTDETFGITLVKVPRGGGGRIQFAIGVESRRVELIGVPFIPFCE